MKNLAEFGTPDLQLGNFELWVHERQFPNAEDYWDGNWLMVSAQSWGSDLLGVRPYILTFKLGICHQQKNDGLIITTPEHNVMGRRC